MTTKQKIPTLSGGLPIIGHTLEFQRSPQELIKRGYAEHGEFFSYRLANKNVAVMGGVENQRTFFTQTDKKLNMNKPYQFLSAMFENAVFLAPHDVYLEQRPMVHEMFKRKKIIEYIDLTQIEVQKMLDRWGDEGEIELTKEIAHLVQEVAGYCFLGADAHETVGREFWDLYAVLGAALDVLLPPHLPIPKFRKRDKAKARMVELLKPVIAARRANPEKYNDMITTMITYTEKEDSSITDDMILNILLALMFAGHETTAGQNAWSIIQALQHPDYLALIQAEIDEHVTPGERFDYKVLSKLKHASWAVDETTRLRPSADMLIRHVEEDIEVGDYVVPAGWLMQVSAEIAHYAPSIWTNPEEYDPLRYSPDRKEGKKSNFAIIGFGGGVHKCTGMNFANNEMIITMAMLFSQYDVELVTKDIGIERGLGASRPTETVIRYRRKAAA